MQSSKMKSITWHNNELLKKTLRSNGIVFIIGILYFIWYQFMNLGLPCVFYKVTGFYCPGCGVTRMFLALSRLDLAEAFRSNPLVLLLLPYGIFLYVRRFVYIMRNGEEYTYQKYHKYVLTLIVVLVLAFGIARNIPYFYYLRPQP